MDALTQTLEAKLHRWAPDVSQHVRELVTEIIDLADRGLLDVARSREVEQEVLDLLDEPMTR